MSINQRYSPGNDDPAQTFVLEHLVEGLEVVSGGLKQVGAGLSLQISLLLVFLTSKVLRYLYVGFDILP